MESSVPRRLLAGLAAPLLLGACAARAPAMPGPTGVVRDGRPLEHGRRVERPSAPEPDEAPVAADHRRAPPALAPDPGAAVLDEGERIAEIARRLVGTTDDLGTRDDCSGFVCAALERSGLAAAGHTASLWEDARAAGAVHQRKAPDPGDLVFFDDTWDRNGNGRLDDALTHVGLVVEITPDGTVLVAHRSSSRGRALLRMNLYRPHDATDDYGATLNDPLRARTRADRKGTRYLAGELFRGFATPGSWLQDGS